MKGRPWSYDAVDFGEYFRAWAQHPSDSFIRNVSTRWETIEHAGHLFPATINQEEWDNSYVCSPYTGIISYPLEELQRVPGKLTRASIRNLIRVVDPCVRWAHINRAISVNNWLLSTNLYPDWDGKGLKQLTQRLQDQYPGHAILFRSLNQAMNPLLCRKFQQLGYALAPSRQVYLFDGTTGDFARHANTRTDLKFLERTSLQICAHHELTDEDYPRIAQLYRWLYLDKYSYWNPEFTSQLIATWHQTGVLQMTGLRNEQGQLLGIVGCFQINQVLSAPLVGYDTRQPQRLGLYRLLMALMLRQSLEERKWLNLSSGAAHFKRLRGGRPEIEYTAIEFRHLPTRSRLAWRTVAFLLRQVGQRVLETHQL